MSVAQEVSDDDGIWVSCCFSIRTAATKRFLVRVSPYPRSERTVPIWSRASFARSRSKSDSHSRGRPQLSRQVLFDGTWGGAELHPSRSARRDFPQARAERGRRGLSPSKRPRRQWSRWLAAGAQSIPPRDIGGSLDAAEQDPRRHFG